MNYLDTKYFSLFVRLRSNFIYSRINLCIKKTTWKIQVVQKEAKPCYNFLRQLKNYTLTIGLIV